MKQTSKLTYKELLEMYPGEDNVRRELIEGELIVAPSPVKRHQYVVRRLLVALSNYVDEHGGECYPAPMDVYFDETNVPEPDVVYMGPDKVDDSELRYLRAVDLVVEVSSPSTVRSGPHPQAGPLRALRCSRILVRRSRCRQGRDLQVRRQDLR